MANHPSNEEIKEQDLIPREHTRMKEPIQFMPLSGNPIEGDFRPTAFLFNNEEEPKEKDDDDQDLTEDGHGNMIGGSFNPVRHPSTPRVPVESESKETEDSQEILNLENNPPTSDTSEEPRHAPGIAGNKQDQPPEQ